METGLAQEEPSVVHKGAAKDTKAEKKKKKATASKVGLLKSETKAKPRGKILQEDKDSLEGPCGSGCIIILRCQRFNNVRCFMVFYCMLIFSQGMVFGLVDLSINNFLKDYQLSIIDSTALSLTYDVSSCLVVVFIAYYGGRGNRPRWIAVSSFIIGFGTLLFSFPYFTGENYQGTQNIEDTCQAKKVNSTCQEVPPSFKKKYVPFFIAGQIVQGIAGMPLYVLGVTFLDDSVDMYSTGIYLGFADASSILGYALGYAIGAPLLNASEINTSERSITVHGYKIKWQWTWWMAFLFPSLIAWSTLIPLSCFPQNLPGTRKIRTGKLKQSHWSANKCKEQEFGNSFKDFFAAIWILMKNPVFVCLALSKATESLHTIGASEFLPKYMENQFVLTTKMATTIAGLVLIPGGALGQFLGGAIIYILEWSCKAIMRFIMVTSAVSNILLVFIIFVRCKSGQFAGITENYEGTGQLGNLTAPCNSECGCSSSFYFSVCGRDGIEYFSPCFAGCRSSKSLKHLKTYYNCSCITKGLTTSDDEGGFIDAKPGTCEVMCYKLPLFISFFFSTIVFSGFSGIPGTVSILRVVSDKQPSLALGIAFVIIRIFGTIPGQLVFKMVGENSCTFRNTDSCRRVGNCWIYNKTKMANLLVGICFICKVFTIFFTAIAFCLYSHNKESTVMMPKPHQAWLDNQRRKKTAGYILERSPDAIAFTAFLSAPRENFPLPDSHSLCLFPVHRHQGRARWAGAQGASRGRTLRERGRPLPPHLAATAPTVHSGWLRQ
ncbi:solute carrier organic anion transporter family member 6A1 [Choloepus didactylus]|uniref:solute carrier organic anion transporter family member 6A1 n=1 Tax=Choloepus didactylus TaxID=27675 RepID=UPI00189FB831|nr:solute carrier organic anion transporter family member 6A1 [Choloepus didactylus]